MPINGTGLGTALHIAARLGSGDRRGKLGGVIRVLVNAGIPVDIIDDDGETALAVAVGDEGIEQSAVAALLELGADPNSALSTAVGYGYNQDAPEAVRLMLAYGGDPNLKLRGSWSLHDVAAKTVEMWEGIVSRQPKTSLRMSAGLDPEASRKRALESARQVQQILKEWR